MHIKCSCAISGVILLLFCAMSAFATPVYMSVSSNYQNYHTGTAEVYSSSPGYGLDYGKAKIEWHYWFNSTNNYWYYAYRVYNNEAGVANDRTDDYHYGYVYDTGQNNDTPINSFDIDLPVQIPGEPGTNLIVLSTTAGSSKGGNAWGPLVDQLWTGSQWVMTGVDWSTTRGGGLTIEPTQWDYRKVQGKDTWVKDYAGDTSRTNQYFEIASTYMPGLVTAHVSNGLVSSNVMLGDVYGPFVPEPATCLLLGLGFLGLSSYRRKI